MKKVNQEKVIREVCRLYDLHPSLLHSRSHQAVKAKRAIIVLMVANRHSLTVIGKVLGYCDHTVPSYHLKTLGATPEQLHPKKVKEFVKKTFGEDFIKLIQ